MKAGSIDNDCGLPVCLMGIYGEECHFPFVGVDDHHLFLIFINDLEAELTCNNLFFADDDVKLCHGGGIPKEENFSSEIG